MAPARLQRIYVLARPIQFSKNPPALPIGSCGAACASKLLLTPLGGGPKNRRFDSVQGNLPTLLQPFLAVNTHFPPRHALAHEGKSSRRVGVGKPSVVVSDLGARKPGSLGTNAESESRYYAPEVGLSTRRSPLLESHFTALSGGTGPRRASRNRCLPLPAGQLVTRTSRVRGRAPSCQPAARHDRRHHR